MVNAAGVRFSLGILANGINLLTGCAGTLPGPTTTNHPSESYISVPYPPSGALAETVPPQPNSTALWVDGDWVFRGRAYVWQRGGWVEVTSAASYAPSAVLYLPDGRLKFAPATWYDDKAQVLPRPERLSTAVTPPNEVTAEAVTGR
jgi:hypothetical protein